MVRFMRCIALPGTCAVLLILTFTQQVTSESSSLAMDSANCRVEANGCSVPLNLPFFYKELFKPACNKHDICYYCGQRRGWAKSACDSAFQANMYSLCKSYASGRKKRWGFSRVWKQAQYQAKLHTCRSFANTYYGSVLVAGSSYYVKDSPSWCLQSCVESRGRP